MHVKSSTCFAREAIVRVLIMSFIRAHRHHLLILGLASDDRVLRHLLNHLCALVLVDFAASHGCVHLPGHEHGKWGEMTVVWHGHSWLTRALLWVVLVHGVHRLLNGCHLGTNLSSRHSFFRLLRLLVVFYNIGNIFNMSAKKTSPLYH